MGAGTYYTYQSDFEGNKEKAFWVDFDNYGDDENQDFIFEDCLEDIAAALESSNYKRLQKPYFYKDKVIYFESKSYSLVLVSKYYGDGLIFELLPNDEEDLRAWANIKVAYYWLGKRLLKHGLKLRIATSGFTSADYASLV